MIVYRARNRAEFNDDEAQIIGVYLERKFGDRPRTAKQVVDAARLKSAPETLHNLFEWDDKIAGEKHRLEQARNLLRHIEVVYVNGGETSPTRAFHHVVVHVGDEGEKETAYVPARVVWQTPDYTQQVIARALAELRGWASRYREYQELGHIVVGIDSYLDDGLED